MAHKALTPELYTRLFDRGVGELPFMCQRNGEAYMGNLVMEKNRLVFKDRGVLERIPATSIAPCWDIGLMGAIADIPGKEWDSLTLLGPDHCRIPVDLSSTRHKLLGRVSINTGENVLGFYGSVYRGLRLMLEYNLLPVVLPIAIETRDDAIGIAIADFRYAAVPLETTLKVNDAVRTAVDRHLTLSVEEVDIDDSDFEKMFGRFGG